MNTIQTRRVRQARDLALDYFDKGYTPFPLIYRSKVPPGGFGWKHWRENRPDRAMVGEWFGISSNIALITGPASGGLVVLDFDDTGAYRAWAERNYKLAMSLHRVITGSGQVHLYMRSDATRRVIFGRTKPVGDILGEVSYVVAPCSSHPQTHRLYRTDGAELPATNKLVGVDGASLFDTFPVGSIREPVAIMLGNAWAKAPYPSPSPQYDCVSAQGDDGRLRADVFAAVVACVPHGRGERNGRVFELAQRVRGLPDILNADPRTLASVVGVWFNMARHRMRTADFDFNFREFCRAWDGVGYVAGRNAVVLAAQRSDGLPAPKLPDNLKHPSYAVLSRLCVQLQKEGRGRFYLGCRQAAGVLGVSHQVAWKRLCKLEAAGLLVCLRRGRKKDEKSTEWQWKGDL